MLYNRCTNRSSIIIYSWKLSLFLWYFFFSDLNEFLIDMDLFSCIFVVEFICNYLPKYGNVLSSANICNHRNVNSFVNQIVFVLPWGNAICKYNNYSPFKMVRLLIKFILIARILVAIHPEAWNVFSRSFEKFCDSKWTIFIICFKTKFYWTLTAETFTYRLWQKEIVCSSNNVW